MRTEVQRKFDTVEADRIFRIGVHTVEDFHREIRDLESSSPLTEDFLTYSDGLLALIPHKDVLSIDVSLPRFQVQRTLMQKIRTPDDGHTKQGQSVERYFVDNHTYLGVFFKQADENSRKFERKIDTISHKEIDSYLSSLFGTPADNHFFPPMYDQKRNETDEYVSDDRFAAFSRVTPDGFHLSTPRMNIVINTLESVLNEVNSNVDPETVDGHSEFNSTLDSLADEAVLIFDKFGKKMADDFRNVLAGSRRLRERKGLSADEDVALILRPDGNHYRLSPRNRLLLEGEYYEDFNTMLYKKVTPEQFPHIMPALLDYLRTYATL